MKHFSFVFCLILLSSASFSQSKGLRIGGRLGIGKSTIKGRGLGTQLGKIAYTGAGIASYQFNKNWGIMAEVAITTKGSRFTGDTVVNSGGILGGRKTYSFEDRYRLFYIEVPLMPKLSIGKDNFHVKIFGGPSINFALVNGKDRTYDDPDFNSNNGYIQQKIRGTQPVEISALFGGGFDVELKDGSLFFIDFRNSISLGSFAVINGSKAYNRYFSIGAGVGYMY